MTFSQRDFITRTQIASSDHHIRLPNIQYRTFIIVFIIKNRLDELGGGSESLGTD